jgi:Fe-S cluster biogenesis protein NfuA
MRIPLSAVSGAIPRSGELLAWNRPRLKLYLTGVRYRYGGNIMIEKVREVLEEIRPNLQADGGDIELVDVDDDGVVKVRLKGSCAGCPMSQMTLTFGVEKVLKQRIPEVKRVESVPF